MVHRAELPIDDPGRSLAPFLLALLSFSLLLSACQAASAPASVTPASSLTSSALQQDPTAESTMAPPPPPYTFWIDPALPAQLGDLLAGDADLVRSSGAEAVQIKITADPAALSGDWIYFAAAPFYSDLDEVSFRDLKNCWRASSPAGSPFQHIVVDGTTQADLTLLWGTPSPDCVWLREGTDLADTLWTEPGSLAVLPLSSLNPSFKILAVDGADPLAPDFDANDYPLKIKFYFHLQSPISEDSLSSLPRINFNDSKLASVALTGVTALVRDTAVIMEEKGITYPAGDIQEILTSADLTHINNEVPFAVDCPPPTPSQSGLQFCSDDRYLELLTSVGTDIVELSGDHFNDWGPEAVLHTIDLYEEMNWLVYGGGRNLQSGLSPVYITIHGNRLVFIGCNGKSDERYATASDTAPGAARCDFDWMVPEIERLSSQGYLVIATMQHEEVDSFAPIAWQQYDFRLLADAGAAIVSGSQAHHPQAIEYTGTSFIHYGLGNLFFDQWYLATRNPELHANKDKAFIDLHYFYDGRHISTRLIPLQFIDNARPRPMTADERSSFLADVFQSSLWDGKWIYLFPAGYYSDGR